MTARLSLRTVLFTVLMCVNAETFYYTGSAVVKFNFNTFSTTRGNNYKLRKFRCHYNLRKYSFGSRIVNTCNSLPNDIVKLKLLILSRTVLINIGLIKMFFSIFMPTLLELEVYRFVCDFVLFIIRAKRTTCARQNSLDSIGCNWKTFALCFSVLWGRAHII